MMTTYGEPPTKSTLSCSSSAGYALIKPDRGSLPELRNRFRRKLVATILEDAMWFAMLNPRNRGGG